MSTETVVKERDESAKTATPPTVSIILPVLNEAPQLERCLASVAGQSYRAIVEIVVADGGSSDDTRSVVAGFPRVVVVDNPRRIRPAGLNAAIAAASGVPMKMGSVRPSPSVSWSNRTGVLDCKSTLTARSLTSTMHAM